VASALAASICCIGPLVAALLGATSLGALVAFHRYRPYFTGITLLFLAGAFYMTYRKKSQVCEPGSVCAIAGPTQVERINRVILWVVTAVVLAVLTFPTWSGWIWG
jgi:mercuric ion transport protein